MPETLEAVVEKVKSGKSDGPAIPIEQKRGRRPLNWSISDQINEDYKVKKAEWERREAKYLDKNPRYQVKPFPGLGEHRTSLI